MAKKSKYLKLSKTDFWKGLIVAVFGTAVSTIGTWSTMAITNGDFSFDMTAIGKAALIGCIAGLSGYLGKNLFSNSDGQFLKGEQ